MVVEGEYIKSNGSGFYENKTGVIWVRSVDREYQSVKKKPKMYMMFKSPNGHFKFVSGLFDTADNKTFSFDEKNEVGIKEFYRCQFLDEGILINRSVS
jgi:hypothetical protein